MTSLQSANDLMPVATTKSSGATTRQFADAERIELQVKQSQELNQTLALPAELDGQVTRYGFAREVLQRMGVWEPRMEGSAEATSQAAVDSGLLTIKADQRLTEPLNRAEAAVILARSHDMAHLSPDHVKRTFKDLSPTYWAGPGVYGLVVLGVLQGFDDETFRPNQPLAFAHVGGLLDRTANPPGMPVAFDPRKEWGERSVLDGAKTSGNANPFSLSEQAHTTRDQAASETQRVDATNTIVDQLNAGESRRYQPQGSKTYCNVFAHDFAFLMGAFVPRVWWRQHILDQHEETGEFPEPALSNTREMTANALAKWFEEWGHRFGWSKVGDVEQASLTASQDHANEGRVVIIVGATGSAASGHITAVVPETEDDSAKRNEADQVAVPLQSESGALPKTRGTSNWFELFAAQYKDGRSIWVHS